MCLFTHLAFGWKFLKACYRSHLFQGFSLAVNATYLWRGSKTVSTERVSLMFTASTKKHHRQGTQGFPVFLCHTSPKSGESGVSFSRWAQFTLFPTKIALCAIRENRGCTAWVFPLLCPCVSAWLCCTSVYKGYNWCLLFEIVLRLPDAIYCSLTWQHV